MAIQLGAVLFVLLPAVDCLDRGVAYVVTSNISQVLKFKPRSPICRVLRTYIRLQLHICVDTICLSVYGKGRVRRRSDPASP